MGLLLWTLPGSHGNTCTLNSAWQSEAFVGGKVEEDVLFLLLWVGAVWVCVNLELRDGMFGDMLGLPGSQSQASLVPERLSCPTL